MSWALIDDNFEDNPTIVGLTHEEFRLYVCALSYTERHKGNGRIPRTGMEGMARKHRVSKRAIVGLVQKDRWEQVTDYDGWYIHDYDKIPRSTRSDQARKAANSRWANNAPAHAEHMPRMTPEHAPEHMRSDASAMPRARGPRAPGPFPFPVPVDIANATSTPKPPTGAVLFVEVWNDCRGALPRLAKPPTGKASLSLIDRAWACVDHDRDLLAKAIRAAARDEKYRSEGWGFETFCRHIEGRWLGVAERPPVVPAASTNPISARIQATLARGASS